MSTFNAVDRGLPAPFAARNIVERSRPGLFERMRRALCCAPDFDQVDAPSPSATDSRTPQPYLRSGVFSPVSVEFANGFALDVVKSVRGLGVFSLPQSLCAAFGRRTSGLYLEDARRIRDMVTEQVASNAAPVSFRVLDYARDAIVLSQSSGFLSVGAICTVCDVAPTGPITGVVIAREGMRVLLKNGSNLWDIPCSTAADFTFARRMVSCWANVAATNVRRIVKPFCFDERLYGTLFPLTSGDAIGPYDPFGYAMFDPYTRAGGDPYTAGDDFARHCDFRFGHSSAHDDRPGEMFDHRNVLRLFDIDEPRFDVAAGKDAILGAVQRYVLLAVREMPALSERPATETEIAAFNYSFVNKLKALKSLGGDSTKPLDERPSLNSLPPERIVFNSVRGAHVRRLPSEAERCNAYIHGATPAIELEVYFLAHEAMRNVSGYHIRSAVIRSSLVTAGERRLLQSFGPARDFDGLNSSLRGYAAQDGRAAI